MVPEPTTDNIAVVPELTVWGIRLRTYAVIVRIQEGHRGAAITPPPQETKLSTQKPYHRNHIRHSLSDTSYPIYHIRYSILHTAYHTKNTGYIISDTTYYISISHKEYWIYHIWYSILHKHITYSISHTAYQTQNYQTQHIWYIISNISYLIHHIWYIKSNRVYHIQNIRHSISYAA